MGQTLSEPVTEKHSETGQDERFAWAVSAMQGWRVSMEDAHTTLLKLDEDSGNAFFAVFDGHGGSSAANFAGEHVAKRLVREPAYRRFEYEQALKKAFLGTDEDLRADPSFFNDPSGCTAVAALLTHDRRLFVANAGDSRSVLSCKGFAKPMSYDHKPTNDTETQRIVAAGGYVEYGRVNGNLALSRAIGDFEFKNNHGLEPEKQIITADPDIQQHALTDDEEFLIIACDGIWDCLSSQQAVDLVRRQIAQRKSLQELCESTIQRCCAPDSDPGGSIGCDNMTMIVVALLNGKTLDQWYDWMVDRVEKQVGYETPKEYHQVFSESRVLSAQRTAAFFSGRRGGFGGGGSTGPGASGFGALARVLGRTGGPATVTFDYQAEEDYEYEDYEDDDDEVGDTAEGGLFGVNRLKVSGGTNNAGPDVVKSLRDQLDSLEDDIEEDRQASHTSDSRSSLQLGSVDEGTGGSPRARIDLPSPTERQGMIDLGVANEDESEQPQPANRFPKLSGPTRPTSSSTGSPLIPTPPVLAEFGRRPSPGGVKVNGRVETETPPPPTPLGEDEAGARSGYDGHKGRGNEE